MKLWIIGVAAALCFLVVAIANWKIIAFLGWIYFSSSSMCGNYVAQEELSPNGEGRAVVFQRDCGAMSGFSTQVSIVAASDALPNEMGNVFIAPGHPDTTATSLHWKDEKTLVITTEAVRVANLIERTVDDVTIEYVER